ncbi:MAG: insulinase family protein, partial [Romboutsia sp.]|nr:insulinase family protein [Romboutsia sp.]
GSISSRLFQKIREEKGLVYSIYSSQSLYRKCGELGIFASMSNDNLKEVYALAVINTVFGGSISSRLFQKIREEKGLVYSIYSSQSLYRKCGELGIFASMSNEYLQEVYDSIIEEIKIIKENYLTDKEISESKEQLKGSYILGLESTSSRMMSIGRNLLLNNKVESTDSILKLIDNVDKETIEKVIDKIFNLDKLGVCIVGRDVEQIKL